MQSVPLAEQARPKSLSEFVGQNHLVGEKGVLTQLLNANKPLGSLLFWGPPGVGKTTLARLLALAQHRPFRMLSAVQTGVKEIKSVMEEAEMFSGLILFLDEIHRFNKAQQDVLLQAVESGKITLFGATTENPSFEINAALLSRLQVYLLYSLTITEVITILKGALIRFYPQWIDAINEDAYEAIYQFSGGDSRKALGLLELVLYGEVRFINAAAIAAAAQQKIVLYDKNGEAHYDLISAFIKSIRGSDPQAAVYWLARMLAGGETVRFIARRMVILASEDIGNANPNALVLATACMQAVEAVGMPEARIILSQTAIYLASSIKSNAGYIAIEKALETVTKLPNTPVPLHLRNAPTEFMKDLGYGKEYKYSHDFVGAAGNQEFLPEGLAGTVFYIPKNVGKEKEIRQYLIQQWQEKYMLDNSEIKNS
jgi:putative ATPase